LLAGRLTLRLSISRRSPGTETGCRGAPRAAPTGTNAPPAWRLTIAILPYGKCIAALRHDHQPAAPWTITHRDA